VQEEAFADLLLLRLVAAEAHFIHRKRQLDVAAEWDVVPIELMGLQEVPHVGNLGVVGGVQQEAVRHCVVELLRLVLALPLRDALDYLFYLGKGLLKHNLHPVPLCCLVEPHNLIPFVDLKDVVQLLLRVQGQVFQVLEHSTEDGVGVVVQSRVRHRGYLFDSDVEPFREQGAQLLN